MILFLQSNILSICICTYIYIYINTLEISQVARNFRFSGCCEELGSFFLPEAVLEVSWQRCGRPGNALENFKPNQKCSEE